MERLSGGGKHTEGSVMHSCTAASYSGESNDKEG